MASSWMGVGVSNPKNSTALIKSGERPSDVNLFTIGKLKEMMMSVKNKHQKSYKKGYFSLYEKYPFFIKNEIKLEA